MKYNQIETRIMVLNLIITQDDQILSIHEKLSTGTIQTRLSGHFISDNIFNLRKKVLSRTEAEVLEKRLSFAAMQKKSMILNFREIFNSSAGV